MLLRFSCSVDQFRRLLLCVGRRICWDDTVHKYGEHYNSHYLRLMDQMSHILHI